MLRTVLDRSCGMHPQPFITQQGCSTIVMKSYKQERPSGSAVAILRAFSCLYAAVAGAGDRQ